MVKKILNDHISFFMEGLKENPSTDFQRPFKSFACHNFEREYLYLHLL